MMIAFLAKRFIPDYENYTDPNVRAAYGTLCSVTAICFNVLLFAAKLAIGFLTASVAIVADALNNLTDAGGAVLILVGFRVANQPPAPNLPFGRGRIEYVSGLVVAALILVTAVEMGRSAVVKILHPEPIVFSWIAVLVLALSIGVKLYMAHFTRATAEKIDSAAMRAAAADYLSDMLSTAVVLLCMVLFRLFRWNLDGWGGLLVSLFILWAGVSSGRETLLQLLGTPPSPELVHRIEAIVRSYDEVVGIHDLVVHDYGPGRMMISLHAEVPDSMDISVAHDAMDRAMDELDAAFGCVSVIHMDPISTDNQEIVSMRERVAGIAAALDPRITIHDFRMVAGPTHTNILFDAVVPHRFRLTDEEVVSAFTEQIQAADPALCPIIHIDKPYTAAE